MTRRRASARAFEACPVQERALPKSVVSPGPPPSLYLDLFAWINLGKQIRGKEAPDGYGPLTAALETARKSGAVRVVLCDALLHEISLIKSPDQREGIADAIDRFTDHDYLLGRITIMHLELVEALSTLHPNLPNYEPVPLVRRSIFHAFGLLGDTSVVDANGLDITDSVRKENPEVDALLAKAGRDFERAFLVGPSDADAADFAANDYDLTGFRALMEERVQREREMAERLSQEGGRWRRGRLSDVVSAQEVVTELLPMALEIYPDLSRPFGNLDGQLEVAHRFIASMPSTSALVAIKTVLHRSPETVWKVNHIHDIDALALAMPYCDVVFADKEMHHCIVSSKLDRRFGTIAPRSPSILSRWLDERTAATAAKGPIHGPA